MPTLRDFEVPDPFGTFDAVSRGRVPVDRGEPLKLQQVARLEVQKQERRARFAQKIAQRVQVTISAEVGYGQPVAFHAHKAGSSPTMGDIGPAGMSDSGAGPARNEEGV